MNDLPKKITDLDRKEKDKLKDFLDNKSAELGLEMYNSSNGGERRNFLEEKIGICYKCKNLKYARGEYITLLAMCQQFETRLNGRDKIIECSEYSERGRLSLENMAEMAYLIDSNKKEVKGFV